MNRAEKRAAEKLGKQAAKSNSAALRRAAKVASSRYDRTPLGEGSRFTALTVMVEEAFVALRDGSATRHEIQTFGYVRSMAWCFSTHRGVACSPVELAELEAARLALVAIVRRAETTGGRHVASGPELNAIREMVRTYEAQVPHMTPADFAMAQAMVRKAANAGDFLGATLSG